MLCVTLALTGCGHEHTWTEATCTEPRICEECGETEGEAIGHTWNEATCTATKTCKTCNETEGETLPHNLTEANFQIASTCTVCGATEGDPLTPYYVEHGAPLMERGKRYDCILHAGDSEYDTVAKVSVDSYKVFDYDDNHPAKEGYEYRVMSIKVFYSDENARTYGVHGPTCLFDDYYDSDLLNDSGVMNEENGGSVCTYKINYNGEEQEACIILDEPKWSTSSGTGRYIFTFNALVPVGYDGVVVGIRDDRIEDPEEDSDDYSYEEGHGVRYRLK